MVKIIAHNKIIAQKETLIRGSAPLNVLGYTCAGLKIKTAKVG